MKLTIRTAAALLCAALALALTACSGGSGGDTAAPEPGAQEPAAEAAPDGDEPDGSPADGRITYEEEEMPQNTPEHEAYVQRYMIPYGVTGIFYDNFGPGNMSELYSGSPGHLLTIFNAFALARPDNDLVLTDEDTTLDREIVEGVLLSRLDLTPEEIRAACADYYDDETGTYTYNYGLGGGPAEFVVTGSSLEDGVLTLEYDFYVGDYEGVYETFGYVLYRQGVLVLEVDGDDFRYISNTVRNAPGIE